jgi:hypothetical protein
MRIVANNGSGTPPALSSWAQVDPARYPFDPIEAAALVRTMSPGLGQSDVRGWRDAVSAELSERYGPWAYDWYISPQGRAPHDWITRFPAPADAPAVAADSLRTWRRWLERIAERFDDVLPSLDRAESAGPADLAATWESAIAAVIRTAIAPVVDDDFWPGRCRMVLSWFLTATGVPVEQAQVLVDDAVDRRFDHWVPPTAVDVVDVAERLTRSMLDIAGVVPAVGPGEWPDTWPQNWPAWRATNTTGSPSV